MRARSLTAGLAMILAVAACGNAGSSKTSDPTAPPASGPSTSFSAADLTKNLPVTAPGVSSTEIKVATITARTNNLTGNFGPLVDGIKAYFDMVNAGGGIYGRKLVVAYDRDDQFGQNRQTVQQSLAQDKAFATFGATALFTGADLLAKTKQPLFMWNINPEFAGHPTFFANEGALCFLCAGHVLPWVAQQLGAKKVGVLAYGIAQQSKDCASGIKSSFTKYPTATVAYLDDSLGYAQTLGPQVAAMKKAGVEFVMSCVDLQEAFTLAKEMQKQGMKAVQTLPQGYDPDFVAKNAALLEGSFVGPQFLALENEPKIPEVAKLFEWAGKRNAPVRELTAVGWQLAAEFYTGLAGAGPQFSQATVVAYLNTLTNWTDNGFIQPLDWTKYHEDPTNNPAVRGPNECGNFVKIENGKFVPVFGEPGKPWVCFKRTDPTVNNPTRVSFVGS